MFISRLPGKGQISKEVLKKTLFMVTSTNNALSFVERRFGTMVEIQYLVHALKLKKKTNRY